MLWVSPGLSVARRPQPACVHMCSTGVVVSGGHPTQPRLAPHGPSSSLPPPLPSQQPLGLGSGVSISPGQSGLLTCFSPPARHGTPHGARVGGGQEAPGGGGNRQGLRRPGAGHPLNPEPEWGRPQSTQLACVLGGRLPAPLPHPRVDPDLTCTCVDTSPETGGLQAAQGKEVSQRAYWVPHFPPQTLPCSEGTGQSGQCEEQGEAPARCGPQGRPGPGRQKDREGWAPSLKCVSRTHLEHVEEPREASDPGQPPATPSMASPGPLTGCGHLANGPSVPLWRAWGSDPVIHTECVAPASVGSSGAPRPLWTLCGRPPRR